MPRTTYTTSRPTAVTVLAPQVTQAPAPNTAAYRTFAAPTDGTSWIIPQIGWSYSGSPTSGTVVISWTDPVAGAVTETYFVTSGGPAIIFEIPRRFPSNTAVTVTLAAAGAGVSGTIYPDGYTE